MSETRKIFDIDRKTLTSWIYHFSEYLSPNANPKAGNSRVFTIDDIRVLAYVCLYWEDNPDLEGIRCGLNSRSHFENIVIDNFITGVKPIFQLMPENINESWRGVVFGGEFQLADLFETANSFKLAGDKLVDFAFDNEHERKLFQPTIYNYRHATELYIKAISGIEVHHNLKKLKEKLSLILLENLNTSLPLWLDKLIDAFNYSDPKGTAFRYGITIPKEELYVDLIHLKELMNWLAETFELIRRELEDE